MAFSDWVGSNLVTPVPPISPGRRKSIISGTPDHVKKRFERYTLRKNQEIAGSENS